MGGVRGFVGVTDNGWYRLLADRPELLGEVNFWRPGGGGFRALRPGEPFFFKTHAPHNRVVGGGFFGGAVRLPASEAWDLLGPVNGAVSLGQMVDRIVHYRRETLAPGEDPVIGCIFIRDVTFFPDDLTFDPPPGFSSSVVQGKGYDMGDERYSRYFGDLMQMVLGVAAGLDLTQPWHDGGPVFGDPRLAPNRLGQQGFKAVVADAYRWRCAFTDARIRPVLEAAHIRPVPRYGGENRLDNGLLLRSDVHRMFDLGYLSVDTRYRLRVSSLLRPITTAVTMSLRPRSGSPTGVAVGGAPHPRGAVAAAADDDRGAIRPAPAATAYTLSLWPVSGSPTGLPSASRHTRRHRVRPAGQRLRRRLGLPGPGFVSTAAGQDGADGCPRAGGTGDVQMASDGGDPLSHQRQAVAGGVRAAAAVVADFDGQDFGGWSVAAILRGRLRSGAVGDRDGYADRRVGSCVLDRVAHRGGDDEVCDLLYFRVGAQVGHVRADRRVDVNTSPQLSDDHRGRSRISAYSAGLVFRNSIPR